jgi:succinate dehydrogenase/fumarate reductase cytochrome b subunit
VLPTQCSLGARAVCVTAGAIALNGDLPAVVDWVRGSVLVYPARAAIAGPLLYHYIGGLRHIAWDHAKCACLHCITMPAAPDSTASPCRQQRTHC